MKPVKTSLLALPFIMVIYLIAKIYVVQTPTPADDHIPDQIMEVILPTEQILTSNIN